MIWRKVTGDTREEARERNYELAIVEVGEKDFE